MWGGGGPQPPEFFLTRITCLNEAEKHAHFYCNYRQHGLHLIHVPFAHIVLIIVVQIVELDLGTGDPEVFERILVMGV